MNAAQKFMASLSSIERARKESVKVSHTADIEYKTAKEINKDAENARLNLILKMQSSALSVELFGFEDWLYRFDDGSLLTHRTLLDEFVI